MLHLTFLELSFGDERVSKARAIEKWWPMLTIKENRCQNAEWLIVGVLTTIRTI